MDLSKVPSHGLYMRDPDYLQDLYDREDRERVAPWSIFRETWRQYYSSTTAHGVPHYGNARGNIKMCFWAILVIAALITVLYNLIALSRDYLSYPSDNVIILNHATSLDFPAVTVCNMNPLKRSAMEARRARSNHRRKRATKTSICDPDWTEYNDHCYRLSTVLFTWENAHAWCESQGAFLIKINNHLENTFIDSWAKPASKYHYWIGLRKEFGTWVWRDGTSPIFVDWDPDVTSNDFCARMISKGLWRATSATPCNSELQFICEKDMITTTKGQSTTGLPESTESKITSQSYLETTDTTMRLTPEIATTDPGLSTSMHSTDLLKVSTTPTTTQTTASYEIITTETIDIAGSTIDETTVIQSHTSQLSTTPEAPQSTIQSYNEMVTTEDGDLMTKSTVVLNTEESPSSEYTTEMSSAGQTSETSQDIQDSTTQRLISNSMPDQSTAMSNSGQTAATTQSLESSTKAGNTDLTSRFSNINVTSTLQGFSSTVGSSDAASTADRSITVVAPTSTIIPSSMPDQSTVMSTSEQTTATTIVESSTQAEIADQTTRLFDVDITVTKGFSTSSSEMGSSDATADSIIATVAHTKFKCCCLCCSPNAVEIGNVKNRCYHCKQESVPMATKCVGKVTDIETNHQEAVNVNHQLQNDGNDQEIIKGTGDVSNTSSHIFSQSLNYSSTTSKSITMASMDSGYPTISDDTVPQSIDNADYLGVNMEATSLLDDPEMSERGYSLDELILDCRFLGQTCDFRQFGHFVNNIHGNCYMFNSGWTNKSSIQKSSRTGRRYGLHMVLNVNQKEYPLSGSDTVGVRVVVHSRDRMPFPEDEGVTVSPGRATSIAIRQMELTSLPKPHGDCIDSTLNHEDVNVFEEKYPVNYSAKACERTCYQRHVIQTCGCGDPSLPRTGTAVSNVSVPVCSTSNHTQDACRTKVEFHLKVGDIKCYCPKRCRYHVFTMGVSIGQWPSKVQKNNLLNNLVDKIGESFSIGDPKGYVDNLIKMEIFYEDFSFQSMHQRPKYKSGGLLSNIGGMLGLWVGFSVFTIIELVEVLIDVALLVPYHRGWRLSRSKSQTEP